MLVFSGIRTTNLSMLLVASSEMGLPKTSWRKVDSTLGEVASVPEVFTMSIPVKNEMVLWPVKAWDTVKACTLLLPRQAAKLLVQFSRLTDWVIGGTWWMFQQRSVVVHSIMRRCVSQVTRRFSSDYAVGYSFTWEKNCQMCVDLRQCLIVLRWPRTGH